MNSYSKTSTVYKHNRNGTKCFLCCTLQLRVPVECFGSLQESLVSGPHFCLWYVIFYLHDSNYQTIWLRETSILTSLSRFSYLEEDKKKFVLLTSLRFLGEKVSAVRKSLFLLFSSVFVPHYVNLILFVKQCIASKI